MKNAKGISPVIATVLLVSLALVLAVMVFMWARTFITEAITKQDKDVAIVCEEVIFEAEAILTDEKIYIENKGNVPLYGVEIRANKILGEITKVGIFDDLAIYGGESAAVDMDFEGLEAGDSLTVVPILLGENDDYKKAFVCDEDFGKEIEIKT